MWSYNDYGDELFFTGIVNLDHPGLDTVKAAAAETDWTAAREALLDYFQKRKTPRLNAYVLDWRYHPADRDVTDIEVADRALKHEFWIRDRFVRCGEKIAWRKPPVDVPDVVNYVHHLNRTFFLQDLAAAYRQTGDEKYARCMVKLLEAFIDGNPLPKLESYAYPKQYGWSQISAAYRFMFTWPPAILALLESETLTADAFVGIMKALYQNLEFVREHHMRRANHCTFEVGCVFMAGVLWPEFSRAAHWREYGLEWLQRQAKAEHYPDGFIKEMSCSYQSAYGLLARPIEFAGFNGVEVDFPQEYYDVVHSAARARMLMLKPDGTVPRYNDSVGRDKRDEVLEFAKTFDDDEMLWIGSHGRRGGRPSVTSHFFPDARYAVMRSSWEEDADYLIMDCGPAGTNHVNANQLSIELCARGIHWIENPGYGRRSGINPMYRWRAKDSRSHSTLNIVGKSQQFRKDAQGYMVSDPAGRFDYAVGWYDGGYVRMTDDHRPAGKPVTGVRHTRRVLYLTGRYWLVLDSLDGDREGEVPVELHWTFPPSEAGFDQQTKQIWTRQDDLRLRLLPADPRGLMVRIAEGEQKPYAGWWSPGNEARRYESLPAPEAVVRRRGPLPVNFATLMFIEEDGGVTPRIVSSKLIGRAAGRLRIKHERGSDCLIVAAEADALASDDVPGLQVRAELLLARLNQNAKPREIHLAHARRVTWRGKTIWRSDQAVATVTVSFNGAAPAVSTNALHRVSPFRAGNPERNALAPEFTSIAKQGRNNEQHPEVFIRR